MLVRIADSSAVVVEAMQAAFAHHRDVEVHEGDLLQLARCAFVSPANSDGFMDGGLDAALTSFFGRSLERAIREAITARPGGRLPVGASLVVPTGHGRIAFVVVAPTMETPGAVDASHAYRAMRAALRIAGPERLISELWFPGLTTGVGLVAPEEAALEMAAAFVDWRAASSKATRG